jgi:hypothetical protein
MGKKEETNIFTDSQRQLRRLEKEASVGDGGAESIVRAVMAEGDRLDLRVGYFDAVQLATTALRAARLAATPGAMREIGNAESGCLRTILEMPEGISKQEQAQLAEFLDKVIGRTR